MTSLIRGCFDGGVMECPCTSTQPVAQWRGGNGTSMRWLSTSCITNIRPLYPLTIGGSISGFIENKTRLCRGYVSLHVKVLEIFTTSGTLPQLSSLLYNLRIPVKATTKTEGILVFANAGSILEPIWVLLLI